MTKPMIVMFSSIFMMLMMMLMMVLMMVRMVVLMRLDIISIFDNDSIRILSMSTSIRILSMDISFGHSMLLVISRVIRNILLFIYSLKLRHLNTWNIGLLFTQLISSIIVLLPIHIECRFISTSHLVLLLLP